jgi:hypothetical protein
MIKSRTTILSILILLSFSVLAQAGVVVDKTSVDIVAGDDIILVYTLSGSSSLCHVSVNITPDPVGFNLTYNPVVICPGILYLYLNTSMALAPGVYSLTVIFESEQGDAPHVSRRVHHTHIIPPVVVDNETDPVIPPVEENETKPPLILPPEQEPCDYLWFYILLFVIGVSILLFFVVRKHKKK